MGFGVDHLFAGNAGDRLAFAGAMFGAASAVIGAALVDARARKNRSEEAREHLAAICDSTYDHATALLVPFNPNNNDAAPFNIRVAETRNQINGLLAERYEFDDASLRRDAGWVHELQLLRRYIYDAEPVLRMMRDRQDIANGHQVALASALQVMNPIVEHIQYLATRASAALRT